MENPLNRKLRAELRATVALDRALGRDKEEGYDGEAAKVARQDQGGERRRGHRRETGPRRLASCLFVLSVFVFMEHVMSISIKY